MENQIICFDEIPLPIKLHNLAMCHGGVYRGIHAHAAVEIVKVKSGQLECYINDDRMQLHAGEIILINSNVGHRLCSENADISYMHIDIHFFTESTNDNAFSKLYEFISRTKAKPYLIFPDNIEMQEIFHKISLRYFENNMSSRWYMKACIYELIGFMYAQSFITTPIISGKQIEKIKSVVRYIDDNFRYPIMLDEICAAVGYNKYAVCHNFKSVTGAAVFDYINFLRVDFAAEKLKHKGSSILEIATESGFSSATYFNRVFKNFFGCSPSVYRKLLTEGSK